MPPEPSAADAEAKRQRNHTDAVARHWKEPVDASWSADAVRAIQADLGEIAAKAGFSVVQTDCRTESCVAVTRWSSYDAAKSQWIAILNQSYRERCGVEVLLNEPPDPAARYETTVLFHCRAENRMGAN
jgi:hypothetical protein